MRGKNKAFIKAGVKNIMCKNYDLIIDECEIDSTLTIGENITFLLNKYTF